MKKYISFITICFLLLVGALASCKSASVPMPTTETNKTVTITETVHDTVFKIEKDNSYYEAYLECVNGKVVINGAISNTISKNGVLQPPKVIIKDNYIKVDCEVKAQELFAQWKSKYIQELTETTNTVPVEVDRGPTFFQELQIWLGRIFLALILLYLGYKYFKSRKIIKT